MATLKTVQAQIAKLQAQANSLIAKQSSAVLEQIRDLMSEHGLTTADIDVRIGGKKRGPKAGVNAAVKAASGPAKYRDPKSGATWSGRGRAPAWIASAKDRKKFLVDGSAASSATVPTSSAKAAGKYVRGPQPAKYQDPKSGATWSGRGPAPAWLASAKDRTRFLIAGTADAALARRVAGAVSKTKSAAKKASAAAGAVAHKGQPKGPQPAKYRDPKTGASWSGRGPAPAWLAAAKDRSKFLSDTVGAVAVAAGSASKTKLATKKAVAKKAVAKTVKATKVPTAKKAAAKKAVVKKTAVTKAATAKTAGRKAGTNGTAAPAGTMTAKKVPRKSAAVTPPVATVESGAESAT